MVVSEDLGLMLVGGDDSTDYGIYIYTYDESINRYSFSGTGGDTPAPDITLDVSEDSSFFVEGQDGFGVQVNKRDGNSFTFAYLLSVSNI